MVEDRKFIKRLVRIEPHHSTKTFITFCYCSKALSALMTSFVYEKNAILNGMRLDYQTKTSKLGRKMKTDRNKIKNKEDR